MFDDALMKIQISDADTHGTHKILFDIVVGCVNVYLLWPALYMYVALDLVTTTIKYSFTVYCETHARLAATHFFVSISFSSVRSFCCSLARSLIHPLLRTLARWVSEWVSEYLCVRVFVCVCVFANFKFQSGFFQLNTFRIQTAINGHRERSRYIIVSILCIHILIKWEFFDEIFSVFKLLM